MKNKDMEVVLYNTQITTLVTLEQFFKQKIKEGYKAISLVDMLELLSGIREQLSSELDTVLEVLQSAQQRFT